MRGGKRTGAGRKAGAVTKKTRAIADAAMTDGITPLEVMLGAMREAWAAGNKMDAADIAKDAAPYMHPRLAAVELSGNADNPIETVTRIELTAPDGYSPDRTTAEADTRIHRPS